MINILIHGLNDGSHEIEMTVPANEIAELKKEFFGKIFLSGKLVKIGNRYSFKGEAKCKAGLVCDLTLKDFDEEITAEINITFIADNSLFKAAGYEDRLASEAEDNIIREDEKYYDLTEEVKEMLELNIPMKKIAPDVRNKTLEEIFPQINNHSGDEGDDSANPWDALKNLKIDK